MTSTHAPAGYDCPFCRLVVGGRTELTDQRDVVHRAAGATAILSPHWWPDNPGHVLVVPNIHHETLYRLPAAAGHAMQDLVREAAVALKRTYDCDGVTVKQNNEPAGDQDVWHVHTHVIPRYVDDGLYESIQRLSLAPRARRLSYAARLRDGFAG